MSLPVFYGILKYIFRKEVDTGMIQVILFALIGFSSALVNLGVYNLVLWGLRSFGWLPACDILPA